MVAIITENIIIFLKDLVSVLTVTGGIVSNEISNTIPANLIEKTIAAAVKIIIR